MSDTNGTADLVFVNGAVYTVDASRSWAGAVAVKSGTIVAVGTSDDIHAWMGAHTEVVDLARTHAAPGLPGRAHPSAGKRAWRCSAATCSELYVARGILARSSRTYAAANPDAPWILGGGWSMDVFPGGTPTKEALDAVVPDRPVFLTNRDGHGAWVNSRALELGRASRATRPTPPTAGSSATPTASRPARCTRARCARSTPSRRRTPTRTTPRGSAWRRRTCTRSGSPPGRTRSWASTTATGRWTRTRGRPDDGELTARVVGALWWDRAPRARADRTIGRRASAWPRSAGSRRPA